MEVKKQTALSGLGQEGGFFELRVIFWSEQMNCFIGVLRDDGKDVFEVLKRIYSVEFAGLGNGVEDRSAISDILASDKEPVFFADGGGTDGVFDQVVVDLDSGIF